MRILLAYLICVIGTSGLHGDELPAPSGADVVSPDAKLELLFTRTANLSGGLTEGPAVAPDGSIYFSDIPFGKDHGMILRFNPETNETTVFSNNSGKSNGLIFDSKGRLLACEGAGYGGRQISRWNVRTGVKQTVVQHIDGKRFNSPNDLCLDRKGRIYFSDPRYVGHEPRELEHRAVYMIDKEGNVSEATHQVVKPNGIAISPDGKTLYLADHDNGTDNIDPEAPPPAQGDMKIYAFKIKRKDGGLSQRRTFVDFGATKGCDGMTVDEHGNVYLTVRDKSRPGVMIVDPTGQEIAFIPTGPPNQTGDPVGLPSNVEFGSGKQSHVLYVTVDTSLYRIGLKVNGFHVQHQKKGKKRQS